ncbi:hypothetical protein BDZ45DRAFT_619452 [Acephala macrosclerotiorum]|nr:hypothetical protein BDZ45DRAFT_619452 [Acephala macrosclerotiorum]
MQALAHPSTSRYQCLRQIWRSLSTGSLIMDSEMANILGITIHSSGGEERAKRPLSVSPIPSDCTSSVYIESLAIAAGLRDSMLAFSSQGMSKLSEWPNSCRVWDPYWGFTAIMTTEDPATALAITVHSCTASKTEILTTEFVACYLVADIAWQNKTVRKDFENTTRTQQRLQREAKESIECEPKPALPRLTIRIISIHRRNIRIINTTFTEEYHKSLSKAGQTSPSNLHVSIESLPAVGYDDAQITHVARKLMMNTSP